MLCGEGLVDHTIHDTERLQVVTERSDTRRRGPTSIRKGPRPVIDADIDHAVEAAAPFDLPLTGVRDVQRRAVDRDLWIDLGPVRRMGQRGRAPGLPVLGGCVPDPHAAAGHDVIPATRIDGRAGAEAWAPHDDPCLRPQRRDRTRSLDRGRVRGRGFAGVRGRGGGRRPIRDGRDGRWVRRGVARRLDDGRRTRPGCTRGTGHGRRVATGRGDERRRSEQDHRTKAVAKGSHLVRVLASRGRRGGDLWTRRGNELVVTGLSVSRQVGGSATPSRSTPQGLR